MSRGFGRVLGLVAALAVSAVVVVGCGDDTGGTGGTGGGDNALVGDWLNDESSNNRKEVWSIKSSGRLDWFRFQKVTNFWIEVDRYPEKVTWRTEGENVIFSHADYPDEDIIMAYSVTGNSLITSSTYKDCNRSYENGELVGEVCNEYTEYDTFTKTNLSDLKRSFGTIHTGDPALRGDGEWRMPSGENIEFYTTSFDESPRRYMSTWYDYEVWYTNGNRLYLLGLECTAYETSSYWCNNCQEYHTDEECSNYTTVESLELQYNITTVGGVKTLTLRNTSRNINDVYEWREYEDDYYYSQSKSKASRSFHKNERSKVLSCPLPRPTR